MISTVTTKTQVAKSNKSITKDMSTHERIMASTMSVDEYFDELTDLVRGDMPNQPRGDGKDYIRIELWDCVCLQQTRDEEYYRSVD